jgi:glycosyltransferase involved in cell wall biosynthesis
VTSPRVSVVLPVRDTERYLESALGSVLDQSFRDFEVLLFDDGSSDGSLAIAQRAAAGDPRVRVFAQRPTGYVPWLIRGVELACGEYVARMDADDVSLPERFARQVAFLDAHPEVVAVGTRALCVDDDGDPIAPTSKPLTHDEIDGGHLAPGCSGSLITHPTVMMRRAAVLAAGNYRAEGGVADDLDLFLRLAERGRLANLPEVLLHYRLHPASVGMTRRAEQLADIARLAAEARRRRGLPPAASAAPAPARAGGLDGARPWIVRAAREHGFARTARKHALHALRAAPWSPASWRLMRLAWLGSW